MQCDLLDLLTYRPARPSLAYPKFPIPSAEPVRCDKMPAVRDLRRVKDKGTILGLAPPHCGLASILRLVE